MANPPVQVKPKPAAKPPPKKPVKGMLSKPPPKKSPYLNAQQNRLINQQRKGDIALGKHVNQGINQAIQQTQQPFDYSGYEMPTGPDYSEIAGQFNPQDWDAWRQEQIGAANRDFENQFGDQFNQDRNDFEQMAYERGWSPGSKIYEQQKDALNRRQSEARESFGVQAMNQAASNASQFGNLAMNARASDIANQGNIYQGQFGAYNNNVADAMARRYQPLQEANMFRAAQSPLMMSDAQFGNQMALGNQQGQFALQAKRMGGGGGATPVWTQAGFPSYQDYAAFEDARKISLANATQGRTPNPWYGVAGSALAGIGYGLLA